MNRLLACLPATAVGLIALAPPLLPARPTAAQTIGDWNSAPVVIPPTTAPSEAPAPRPSREPAPPPQVLQAPAELRRSDAPLLPGQSLPAAPTPWRGGPSIRIAPGPGVRPQPRPLRPPTAPAPAPPSQAPTGRPPGLRVPVAPAVPQAPIPALPPKRVAAPAAVERTPRPAVPSFLESLPPGTIQPLPGEILPGGGAGEPRPKAATPPPAPQAVPPPPWMDRQAPRERQPLPPWAWLLVGLGMGGTAVYLLQERRRQPPTEGMLQSLDIRVVPVADAGVQTLRAAATPGEPAAPDGGV